jgi:hypothetical protein
VPVVCRLGEPDTDNLTAACGISRDRLHHGSLDSRNRREVRPLVRVWFEIDIQKDRIAVLACVVLKGQRDQVAEAFSRHRVLVWAEPIVRLHAELMPSGHRFCDEIAAHLPGDSGGDGGGKEEPVLARIRGGGLKSR